MPSHKKSYAPLALGQKVELCKVASMRPRDIQALAEWATRVFDLRKPPSKRTLYNILRDEAKLRKLSKNTYNYKKAVDPEVDALDRALLAEFDKMEVQVRSLTDYGLMYLFQLLVDEHFKYLPDEKRTDFSKGWIYRFQKRHGIRCHRRHGENASVDPNTAIDGRANMRKIMGLHALKDIYNINELVFFYHAESPRTFSRRNKVAGYKADRTLITMALTTNADGSDKMDLLFIGRSKQPRAFKRHDVAAELDAEHTNSKKAWMNGPIFLNWLRKLDLRMRQERRHILLLVDNASSHKRLHVPLSNVPLEFLPKNTTSVLQPPDQGIIACIKSRFNRVKMEESIDRYVAGLPQQKISFSRLLSGQQWLGAQLRQKL